MKSNERFDFDERLVELSKDSPYRLSIIGLNVEVNIVERA